MIEQVLNLFQQFKARKKADDIVMGAGDRELTGALAIAAAINKLADTIAEFKPIVGAAVDMYLSEQTYVCDGEEIEVSTENMKLVQRILGRRAGVEVELDEDEDAERREEKNVFADPIDGPNDPSRPD